MAPVEVELRAERPGVLTDATRAHPGLVVEAFPMTGRALLNLAGTSPPPDALPALLRTTAERIQTASVNGSRAVIVDGFDPAGDLARQVSGAGAVLLPPVVWSDGALFLRVLAPVEAAVAGLVERLAPARVLSKRPAGRPAPRAPRTAPAFLDPLTERQAEALDAAIRLGYYESPRRVTTADVARSMGLSRSAFEERLRLAESRVVHAMAPLVRLRAQPAPAAPADAHAALQTYAHFSRELGQWIQMRLRDGRVAEIRITNEPEPEAEGREHPFLARILHHLSTGDDPLTDLPVDLEVGPFERRVLEALRKIPPGQVLTYGELARRLGHPRAARAVGNAVARNPVPLVVPCHRVVPAAGGVGNYSGGQGPPTKAKILQREGAWPPPKPTGPGPRPTKQRRLADRS